MAHKFHGHFSMLESDERKKQLPAKDVLEAIGLAQGDSLIDFGCGIGYFSIPAAKIVGDYGRIIAIDESATMVHELKRRTKGMKNIQVVKSDSLGDFKADFVLMVNVLHEVDDPKVFLNECFNHLNPGGKAVIVDWQKKETLRGPPLVHRIAKEEVIAMTDREHVEHKIDETLYFLEFLS